MSLINIQKVKDLNKVKGLTGKLAAGISCCRLWGQEARWPPFVSHTLARTFHLMTLYFRAPNVLRPLNALLTF